MTSQELGIMMMRRAAARPVSHSEQEGNLYTIADCVMQAAQTESALWTSRMRDEASAAQQV